MATKEQRRVFTILFVVFLSVFPFRVPGVYAVDSDLTRVTLTGLTGVYVIVEHYQPAFLSYHKYIARAGVTTEDLKQAIENRLRARGIKVLSREEWLHTPGRPVLCLTVNTHEGERYVFAYDVSMQLLQVVMMEANPQIKSSSVTWSLNMTGTTHIGNLGLLKQATLILTDRFIAAWKAVNH